MIRRVRLGDGLVVYRSDRLAETGVRHAFSTREGGVSPSPRASLHLGPRFGAPPDGLREVDENFRRLLGALGLEARDRVEVRQVHGPDVHVAAEVEVSIDDAADAADGADAAARADAIVVDRPGTTAVVRVADCVPVLLAAEGGGCVAAVHSGWRGTVAGVVPRAVEALAAKGHAPPDLVAAIGPCIGPARYEVGAEVAEAFESAGLGAAVREGAARPHVDLAAAIRMQLASFGVPDASIEAAEACTFELERDFFSHRRDGEGTGRMAAVIAPAVAS